MVDFDENGVGRAHLDTFFEELGVGDKQVVADELAFVADLLREFDPAFPVFFRQAVFD